MATKSSPDQEGLPMLPPAFEFPLSLLTWGDLGEGGQQTHTRQACLPLPCVPHGLTAASTS